MGDIEVWPKEWTNLTKRNKKENWRLNFSLFSPLCLGQRSEQERKRVHPRKKERKGEKEERKKEEEEKKEGQGS